MARNPAVYNLIYHGAKARGLDPAAVLAVAQSEGGIQYNNPGDNNTSFGPFQLHIGGALPSGKGAAWANSPAGINYALDQIAGVARGLHGHSAIDAIVRRFERPAAPTAEVSRASGYYGGFASGAPPAPVSALPGAPPLPGAPKLPAAVGPPPAAGIDLTSFLTEQLTQLSQGRHFDPLQGIAALSQQMAAAPVPAYHPPATPGAPAIPSSPTVPSSPSSPRTVVTGAPAFSDLFGTVPTHGTQAPTRIVLHDTESTGTGTGYAKSIADYWNGEGKGYGVHAIIASDGTISRLVKDNAVAYHVGGANTGSLGIEIAGKESWTRADWLAHPKQLEAVAQQVGYWSAKYGIPIVMNTDHGISTHAMQSALHPESQGHTDPGPGFPLQDVLAKAKQWAASYGHPSNVIADLPKPDGTTIPVVSSVKPTTAALAAVELSKQYLGTPYVWAGAHPGGFDCSGLLKYVWGKQGVDLADTTYIQFKTGKSVARNKLRPGDAVFFHPGPKGPEHEGMYIGNDQMIEAPHTGDVVKIVKFSTYDPSRYMGARRFG